MDDAWRTPLVGELVRLDPLVEGDTESLWAALNADAVWEWMPVGRLDHDRFSEFVDHLLADNSDGSIVTWVVRRCGDGLVIGTSSYLAIRAEHRGVEIGMTMYAPAAWRTGANVEAKLLMLGHGFERLGLQRIEFKTDARNERSRNALVALPANFEGIFRHHMDTAQGVRDSAYFSVIDDEWPAVKRALEARLARRIQQ